jgi:hypothetical protein
LFANCDIIGIDINNGCDVNLKFCEFKITSMEKIICIRIGNIVSDASNFLSRGCDYLIDSGIEHCIVEHINSLDSVKILE